MRDTKVDRSISRVIDLSENGLNILLAVTGEGALKLLHFSSKPFDEKELHYRDISEGFNLFELDIAGFDRPQERHGTKYIGCMPGNRMQYVTHSDDRDEYGRIVKVETVDEMTSVHVISTLRFFDNIPVMRIWHDITNQGGEMQTITFAGTFEYSAIDRGGSRSADDKLKVTYADNKWQGELMYRSFYLREIGQERTQPDTFVRRSSNRFQIFNAGNWSTKHYLPMGMLENEDTDVTYFWQIENNGSWGWEISDQNDHLYLQLYGPTENESHWFKDLQPGETFRTVPAAVGACAGGIDCAMGHLTDYRRKIRRPNADNETLPVIFNDYMNCLFGDPTTEKEMPLIDAAADAGAEYFVIDAGWYSDGDWWDSVGEWKESRKRFPGGLKEVTDRIRERGMIPGAWLEIEVMGINCKMAKELPDECFFMRHGKRIFDRSRYQLDFRHPLVIEHANEVVDRIVRDYGVGYIKMDYNIEPGFGTEVCTESAGQGLLEHERAYLAWLDSVWARHPELVIENCSSGGMRIDYAMLSRYSIQSTSDQENYMRYSMITANAPAALTPEQAAVWSYPMRNSDPEETIFNMINAIPLRVHQSGHLGELSKNTYDLVKEGLDYYKSIRDDIKTSHPFWPLGLSKIGDKERALGLKCQGRDLIAVWCIDSPERVVKVPVSHAAGRKCSAFMTYPKVQPLGNEAEYDFDSESGILTVKFGADVSARFFEIRYMD